MRVQDLKDRTTLYCCGYNSELLCALIGVNYLKRCISIRRISSIINLDMSGFLSSKAKNLT